ncbi:hypothetical protein [Corynebacterium crudilactis]|uniref:2TM domain-containing protein n=1 Tax=Corynebacterium crudilactis TaxID=1652495 RepID=A0A172QRK9_9CORY|nr:hypothetical protein [Corynebacterium crudilactis]ANE03300.1 hypothetical protein ccrud_03110 [Corynebacterium crudilactis]
MASSKKKGAGSSGSRARAGRGAGGSEQIDQSQAKFTFQPTRTLLFSIIFTVLVMWQSGFSLWYAIPMWFFVWAIFILGHSFYNWANLKLIQMGRRNKQVLEEQEQQKKKRGF